MDEKNSARFPIVKPQISETDPKFPYRDNRHYTDPTANFPKKSKQVGYTAKLTLQKSTNNAVSMCHSPELPTSHPWFEPAP
ncbi:CLUMA_CG004829, isoform A [Clunio marinus]|uniref:CLUMA_CG004827, isoform A n=1 Tax=Clunio marinus TaxID=568069 RepID=A0A1J1HSV9_9DIPT|nr:CLUMA_CG004827, isoform A [Clunio marinus]CRK91143.1 CLUMA_CG004829, isoform A [Clunio marinus]